MFWKPPCFREGHVHKMKANCYEIERLDPRFPPSILELPSPPNKLYVRGNIELLNRPELALRRHTAWLLPKSPQLSQLNQIYVLYRVGLKAVTKPRGALPLLPVASTLLSWGVAPMSFTRVLLSRSSI